MSKPRIATPAEERRYETCKMCGRSWNVSVYLEEHIDGYLCPRCRRGLRNERNIHKGNREIWRDQSDDDGIRGNERAAEGAL